MGLSRPRSASSVRGHHGATAAAAAAVAAVAGGAARTRTATGVSLQASKLQPTIVPAPSSSCSPGQRTPPGGNGGGSSRVVPPGTDGRRRGETAGAGGRRVPTGKNGVLNWYRLPANGAWAPSARAVSSDFVCFSTVRTYVLL